MSFYTFLKNFSKPKNLEESEDKSSEKSAKEKTTHENDTWEITKSISYDPLGEVITASDTTTGKSISFPTAESKDHYDKNFKESVSYNDLFNIINPTGITGKVNISIGEATKDLIVSFNGKTKEQKESWQFTMKLTMTTMPFGGDEYIELSLNHIKIPEENQGTGFMRDFVKQSIPLWDKLMISKINATADLKNGGYALAKYGFDFKNPLEKQKYDQKFRQFVEAKGIQLPEEINFEHSWDIANTKIEGYAGIFGEQIGKEFMVNFPRSTDAFGLSNAWQGELNLDKGSNTREQFISYFNGKITKKGEE